MVDSAIYRTLIPAEFILDREESIRRWTPEQIAELRELLLQRNALPSWISSIDVYFDNAKIQLMDLRGIVLRAVDLSSVDLSYCALDFADMSAANLSRTRLQYSRLRGATLAGANFERTQASPIDAERASFSGAQIRDSFFMHSNLSGANFSSAILKGTSYVGSALDGIDATNAEGIDTAQLVPESAPPKVEQGPSHTRDALPVLAYFIDANIKALDAAAAKTDHDDIGSAFALASSNVSWIFSLTSHLARDGRFTSVIRSRRFGTPNQSATSFVSPDFVVQLSPSAAHQTAFAREFGLALAAMRSHIDLEKASSAQRRANLSRLIAASALTAHISLESHSHIGVVDISPRPGESQIVAQAELWSILTGFSKDEIVSLPVAKLAAREAMASCVTAIRQWLATLDAKDTSKRVRYRTSHSLANVLNYLTYAHAGRSAMGFSAKNLRDAAAIFLVDQGVFGDLERAHVSLSLDAEIGRLSVNMRHVSVFRGRQIYLQHLMRSFANHGIPTSEFDVLTPQGKRRNLSLSGSAGDSYFAEHESAVIDALVVSAAAS